MALKVLFDIPDLPQNDFGRQINFKIYDERNDTPFDCTFATGGSVLKTFDSDGNQLVPDIPVTWVTKNQGVGYFSYTQSSRPNMPTVDLYLCVQMWDTAVTQQTSTTLRRITITAQPSKN